MQDRAPKRLAKKAKRGFRGYPAATVVLYGPDDATATKMAVASSRPRVRRRLTCGAGCRAVPISAGMPISRAGFWRSLRRRVPCP